MKAMKRFAVLFALVFALSLVAVTAAATGAAPEESTTVPETTRNVVGSVADRVAGVIGDVANDVAGAVGDIAQDVANAANDVSAAANDAATDVSEAASDAAGDVDDAIEDVPDDVPIVISQEGEVPVDWETVGGDSAVAGAGLAILAIALFGLGLPSLVFTILAIVFLVKFVGNRKQVKELQARANGAYAAPQYPNNR